jgi:mono/diheme cytochrome c family protein
MRDVKAAVVAGVVVFAGAPAWAQEAAEYFKQNCFSCHTIGGGKLVGPDLKDVTTRRERAWLVRFVSDPKAMIDRGDAAAQQLLQEYRGVLMPTPAGMNAARAESMIKLIEDESKLPKSQFLAAAGKIPDRAFTASEIESGRQLFLGVRPLANGGPSCISCHAVHGAGGLGGGRLGPDLTTVYSRLEARNGLAGWLSAPPSPTMGPVYKKHPLTAGEGEALGEIALLVAYLEQANQHPADAGMVDRLNFLLLGLGGAAGCFVLFDILWRRRFRSVREELVGGGSE